MAVTYTSGGRVSAVSQQNSYMTPGATNLQPGSTVEARSAVPCRVPGTFSGLQWAVSSSGTGRQLQFRVNSANGSQVVSATDGTSGVFTALSSEKDHLNSGDTFDLLVSGSSNNFSVRALSMKFLADAGTKQVAFSPMLNGGGTSSGSWTITSYSIQLGSIGTGAASSTFVQKRIFRNSATVSNMVVSVVNVSSTVVTVTSQLTSSAGKLSVTYSSNVTGIFEDTTNSDTLVSSDQYSFINAVSTAGQLFHSIGTTIAYPTAQSELFGLGFIQNSSTQGAGFLPLYTATGSGSGLLSDEGVTQMSFGEDGSLRNMRFNTSLNGNTATQTYRLRKNGADANQNISLGAGLTGIFEDTTNTDTFNPTDLFNFSISSYSGTTNSVGVSMSILPVDYIRGYPTYAIEPRPRSGHVAY